MGANREYKSSVFTLFLTEEQERLIEVYNAVYGTNYGPDTPLEINTLEDALFMDRINDISFILNNELVVLIEHQSTVNRNMALRLLIYVGRVYEKVLSGKAIYAESMIPLPTPRFIMFYNGNENEAEHSVQRLSQAFKIQDREPVLELVVDVYNINYKKEKNPAILQKSQSLLEYSTLIHYIKKEADQGQPLKEAIRKAIAKCKEENIMTDFLEKHGSEVDNLLFTEWKWEDAKEVWTEEARAKGIAEGRAAGREEGRAEGRAEGREEGREEERTHSILTLKNELPAEKVSALFNVPLGKVKEIWAGEN